MKVAGAGAIGYTRSAMSGCGHPLCPLVGAGCSLDAGVSRGCRTGPRVAAPFAPEVVDEVAALLEALGDPAADSRAAATRLAFLFRREARDGRNLLALASEEEDALEPALAARLVQLCRRRA